MSEILQIAIGTVPDDNVALMESVEAVALADGVKYTVKTTSEYPELSAKDAADMMRVDWLLSNPDGEYYDWDVLLTKRPTRGTVPLFGRRNANKPSIHAIVPCGQTAVLRAMQDHLTIPVKEVQYEGEWMRPGDVPDPVNVEPSEYNEIEDMPQRTGYVPRFSPGSNAMEKALMHICRGNTKDSTWGLIPTECFIHNPPPDVVAALE